MQSLPDIPPERRAEAARALSRARRQEFTAAERDDDRRRRCLRVLDDPRFAALFAPGSRAEVPIVGRIAIAARPSAVSGQVDRLVVTPDAVLIADYKTNRPAPRDSRTCRPAMSAQLALYRAVLRKLYPDRAVRAALIWTEVPDLMEISADGAGCGAGAASPPRERALTLAGARS